MLVINTLDIGPSREQFHSEQGIIGNMIYERYFPVIGLFAVLLDDFIILHGNYRPKTFLYIIANYTR